jgi:hypothetical protein
LTTGKRECLPVKQVLEMVVKVEQDVQKFYGAAAQATDDGEVLGLFARLSADMKVSSDSFARVCESLDCGATGLDSATERDLQFLSVLAESQFYRKVGNIENRAAPQKKLVTLVENALALERDLLLFHTKFHSTSCAAHRPVFSDLIQRGQHRVSDLLDLHLRLLRRK